MWVVAIDVHHLSAESALSRKKNLEPEKKELSSFLTFRILFEGGVREFCITASLACRRKKTILALTLGICAGFFEDYFLFVCQN